MTAVDLFVSPLGRVEGDLDVRVTIEDGVVTSAWTEAAMFRGFEIILRGKDPQAGLIVTPRICGICGGSHLYKSAYALDTAWSTHVPHNATLVRNIGQACETLQSIPRYFYALFAIDLTNKNYARSPLYEEAVRRFAPYVGTSYGPGVVLSGKPVEVYAIFGGQWPHSSFMVPGGVMCAPTLSDVTRSIAILEHWKDNWLEKYWLGCTVERWLENRTWEDVLAWVEESESQLRQRLRLLHPVLPGRRPRQVRPGRRQLPRHRNLLRPRLLREPDDRGPQRRADQPVRHLCRRRVLRVRPGQRARGRHPLLLRGQYRPASVRGRDQAARSRRRPAEQGKYSFAKSPRYDVPGMGYIPLEAGPLARRMAAAAPGARRRTRTRTRCSSTSSTRSARR